jgi:hypothetical protein
MNREVQTLAGYVPPEKSLTREMNNLPWHYLGVARITPIDPPRQIDLKLGLLFQDLSNGAFWHAIGRVDGYKEEKPEEQQARRDWARSVFTSDELDNLFKLCVQTALASFKSNWPGSRRGYSILNEDIIEKPGSMFREKFNDKQVRTLNNGRFWESLPTVHEGSTYYWDVEDVLANHSDDLSLEFVPEGLKILTRNSGGDLSNFWHLGSLSPQANLRRKTKIRN